MGKIAEKPPGLFKKGMARILGTVHTMRERDALSSRRKSVRRKDTVNQPETSFLGGEYPLAGIARP